ncbi:MAG: FliM/FliN family flagellar motor C-terminal domain-containing protein [Betaproteobacteria bacterium]|nr:FliM/FliN family flagellar motor C-terminal domain-containing protein [Betaproteobacteria bacterium]
MPISEPSLQPAADLPVEVQVRVAQATLSLRQLAALAPGDVLKLAGAFPHAQAVAAGSVFAEVEIVESASAARLRVRSLAGD